MNIDASQEFGGKDVEKVRVIYRNLSIHLSIINKFLSDRKDIQHSLARGLCSRVYKISKEQQYEKQFCIKRVDEDDQYAPHSVQREVLAYSIIGNVEKTKGSESVMNLVAAFKDESDDFTTLYDLVMPWYPCTLQDLLDQPSFQISKNAVETDQEIDEEQRPASQIVKSISDPIAFIQKVTKQLFSALTFLHGNGIAHRDVKPTNILLKTGESIQIQLIDFGTCFLSENRYTPGDDGKGGIASEVGTGAYRAPECLLSPLDGYDPYKVDIWQAGVTLAEFFLPVKDSNLRKSIADEEEEDVTSDNRLEWERALWSKDDGKEYTDLHNRFEKIQGHSEDFFVIDEPQVKSQKQPSQPVYRRQTLFEGSRGDLGLANSIFDILGLPNGDAQGEADWPEAVHFQPSLSKLPFRNRLPREGGLTQYLSDFISEEEAVSLRSVLEILQDSIQLSAKKRIEAAKAIERFSN